MPKCKYLLVSTLLTTPDRSIPDLLDPLCPTRQVVDAIGDKWTSILIIFLDLLGPTRFNELARHAQISFKVLTAVLRRLERDGFVTRTVVPTRPPAVTYALTPLGISLLPVLATVRVWAEANVPKIAEARVKHDRSAL